MLFTRLVAKSTNLDRVKQKFTQRYSGNFADGIKKGVKDVIDADERRNKNKIRISGVFGRDTPIFAPQRLTLSKRIGPPARRRVCQNAAICERPSTSPNRIPTKGKRPMPCFRLYGPEDAYFDKTFKLPDCELVVKKEKGVIRSLQRLDQIHNVLTS